MKKILFILIGVIIGILMSFIFATFFIAPCRYAFDESFDWAQVDNLMIVGDGYNGYGITLDGDTNLIIQITIPDDKEVISDISIMNGGNSFYFADLDQDGMIDRWTISNNKSSFIYGRTNGYPDTVFNQPDEVLVRIDEEYFRTREIDEKKFIEKDGKLVQLEFVQSRYFKIKESEPVE